MGVREAWSESLYHFRHQSPGRAAKSTVANFASGAVRRIVPVLPNWGTNVYERHWDVLVVLDACRTDALQEVSSEYEFLSATVPRVRSVGTKTVEWMENTFTEPYREEMKRTAYVTFNPNSDEVLDSNSFLHLAEVWRDHWDDQRGGVPPRAITDHAVSAKQSIDPDRLIVHYKQPHQPYSSLDEVESMNRIEDDANDRSGVFGALIEGRISRDEAWEGYLDELRLALDDIELLLSAIDAEDVVITADHGECFGEWGLYGHPGSVPVPELWYVPWVKASAERSVEYEPSLDDSGHSTQEIEDKLAALGYRD